MKYDVISLGQRAKAWDNYTRYICFANGNGHGQVRIVEIGGQPHVMIKTDYFSNDYIITDNLCDCDAKTKEARFQWRVKWLAHDIKHDTAYDIYEKETINKIEIKIFDNENEI